MGNGTPFHVQRMQKPYEHFPFANAMASSFFFKSVADSSRHMNAREVTANSCPYGLPGADFISFYAFSRNLLHIFPMIFSVVKLPIIFLCQKSLNGLHIHCHTVRRAPKIPPMVVSRLRTISIFLFMGSNFYYRIDHMGSSGSSGNQFHCPRRS